MGQRICSVEGCEKAVKGRGWCAMHYERWRTKGTTDISPPPTMEERFWAKVDKTPTCWVWTAGLSEGYGSLGRDGGRCAGSVHAHRYAYELLVGPVPSGLAIDHKCRNRKCVNPSHMHVVTRAVNNQNLASVRPGKIEKRGVYFDNRRQRYIVRATVGGRTFWGGQFRDLADAEAAAVELRNKHMVNNQMDRRGV